MIKYILNQVIYKGKMRLLISSVLIFSTFLIFSDKFSGMDITLLEFMLLLLSDKFVVLFVYTIIFVLLIPNNGVISNWDIIVLPRMNIKRWYINHCAVVMLNAIFYVVLSYLLLFIVGLMGAFNIDFNWSEYISSNYIYNIDGFDPAGTPFILLIYYGISPLKALWYSGFLSLLRCAFFGLISLFITLYTNKQIVGGIITIILGYFDVFSSNIFGILKTGLFPYENTIITSILEFRLPFSLSVIYWFILIGFMILAGLISADITVERHITQIRTEGESNE